MTRHPTLSIGALVLSGCLASPFAARAQTAADATTRVDIAQPAPAAASAAPDKSGHTLFDPTPDSQLRSFSTDRPNKSNSPYTVDAGHLQYETDLFGGSADGYGIGHQSSRTLFTADPVLKLGLTNAVDLEVGLGGYQNVRTKQRDDGPASVAAGFGDVTVRAKINLWGDDGGKTALALIPYVKIPTAARGLGNNEVEGGIIAPFQISLPADFTALFETEFDVFKNANDGGKHAGYANIVNVSHPLFSPKLTASVEFASQLQASDLPSVYTLDLALTYLLGPNTQIDAAVYAGLNKAAPDAVAYVGLSQRF